MSFVNSDHENKYTIQLDDMDLMEGNQLYLIVESEDPSIVLSINKDSSALKKSKRLLDIISHSGNIMFVLDDSYYNDKISFFKETKQLSFEIRKMKGDKPNYKIKVLIQAQAELEVGKSYSTKINSQMNEVRALFTYKNKDSYQKIRFQTRVQKADSKFSLSATVTDPTGATFILNEIFRETIGGLIDNDRFPLCKKEVCDYSLRLSLKKVKSFIMSCEVSEAIETLSYLHYGPYYERKFKNQEKTTYFLPFIKEVENLDITINLIPVTGQTGLYVHSKTLPQSLEFYNWQEKGNLAKRITIRNEELKQMKAENSNLFITVYTEDPGEYLIDIFGHEANLKGVLNHGVIESGFIKKDEISNYIYMFEVYQTEEISFTVTLNIMSGQANLYLKECKDLTDCEFTQSNIKDASILRVENQLVKKVLQHQFKCKHKNKYPSTICYYVIGINSDENHGTHYDLNLHEDNKHRLITPGHLIKTHLGPTEKQYFKFSFPSRKSKNSKLILSVEAVWGNFSIYISKNNEFPSNTSNHLQRTFQSSKSGLYSSMQEIVLDYDSLGGQSVEGPFYIAIESLTSCQVNIKFYEFDDKKLAFHILSAGEQQRGTIHQGQEMVYFNIKASLNQKDDSSVTINITPIKGSFEIFTAREGKFPTKTLYDQRSKNNVLELTQDDYTNKEEYIIGVSSLNENKLAETLQFMISFDYSSKPMKLKPGILSNFYTKNLNLFIIEVSQEISDLLVLQSYRDSNMKMCAFFNGLENFTNTENQCQFDSNNSISLYLKRDQVTENCEKFPKNSCFLIVKLEGEINHKFSLGFTYNDKPFKIVKENIIQGPQITKGNHKLNFIQHLDLNSDEVLFFDSKGIDMNIYTKLIDGDKIGDELIIPFPTNLNHDQQQRTVNGNVTSIFYSKETIQQFGKNPELLISVRPNPNADTSELIFDGTIYFTMHSGKDSIPLTKNKSVTQDIRQEEMFYFNFYNSGENDFFTIQITSNSNALLTAYLSQDLNSMPPFSPFLIKKSGFGQVIIITKKKDLKGSKFSGLNSLRGHYTVGVKCSQDIKISIFWNNMPHEDIFELTPGHPTTIYSTDFKEQYFIFYARDKEQPSTSNDRGKIKIYINSQIRCNIYIASSQKMNETKLEKLNKDYLWKSSIGIEGGVHLIEINPSDPNYCINCSYYGYLESISAGQVQILTSVEHFNQAVNLMNGFTYPEVLRKNEKKVYQYFNGDIDSFSLSFSIISGQIKIFIHTTPEVSGKNFIEEFQFGNDQKYGYITVEPTKYQIKKEATFYYSIEQYGDSKVAFNMSVLKKNLKMQMEVGITKTFGVGANETAEFFFVDKKYAQTYNLDLEIIQMDDTSKFEEAKLKLKESVEVYQDLKKNGQLRIPLYQQTQEEGRLNLTFNVENSSNQNYYTIKILNKNNTFMQFNFILTQNTYKLLHSDENSVEIVTKDTSRIFEVIAQKTEFLYFDLKECRGNTNVNFYEGDYDRINYKKNTDSKTLNDKGSLVYFIEPLFERVFIKVEVSSDSPTNEALINIKTFNQKEYDQIPKSELQQINTDQGNLKIDTEHSTIQFEPIDLKFYTQSGYRYRVDYIVYLTDSDETRKFLKNCQQYYYEKFYPDNKFRKYVSSYDYENQEEMNKSIQEKISINLIDLEGNKKHFGVVLIKISQFSPDQKQLKPIKQIVHFYQEFVFLSPRYQFSFIYAVGIVIVIGFLYVVYYLINDYVFGQIMNYKGMTKLSEFNKLENNVFGFNTLDILEDEYYILKGREKEGEVRVDRQEEPEEDQENEFELTDRNVPFEMDL